MASQTASTKTPLTAGMFYHIYNRGNNREDIFIEHRNYYYFLGLYGKYIEPIAETLVYCLLRNHFHLLVRIKSEEEIQTFRVSETRKVYSPSHQFSNLFSTYTKAINKAYARTGSLFEKPFKRVVVDDNRYYHALISYIHRNPQIHGFTDDFRTWPYSSYQAPISTRPTKVARHHVLDLFGTREELIKFHEVEPDLLLIENLIVDE